MHRRRGDGHAGAWLHEGRCNVPSDSTLKDSRPLSEMVPDSSMLLERRASDAAAILTGLSHMMGTDL
jgi:hypothetical protein